MQGRRQRHQVGREQGGSEGGGFGQEAVGERAGTQEGGAVVGLSGHAGAVASLFVLHVHGHTSHARPHVQAHVPVPSNALGLGPDCAAGTVP